MLFGRQVVVEFGPEGGAGIRFANLRVGFDVKMDRTRTPSTATITIWNMSAVEVSLLELPLSVVRLLVGYSIPPIPRLIFQGTPIKGGVKVTKQGPDRIVTIDAADGGRVYGLGRFEFVSATPVGIQTVFNALVAQLAPPIPIGVVTLNQAHTWPRGLCFSGLARDMLDRIADISLADWYIRDNVLYVVPKGVPTPDSITIFNSTAGNLIGDPTKKDNGVEITGLAEPSMRPGRQFQVITPDGLLNGIYLANDVQFVGGSGFDTPFYVKVTGTPVGG